MRADLERRTYAVGALSLLPAIYLVAFFVIVGIGFTRRDLPVPFGVLLVGHSLTILVLIVLLTICIRHAHRTPQLPADKRASWVVLLVFFNAISIPVYWWRYMRPSRPSGGGDAITSASS